MTIDQLYSLFRQYPQVVIDSRQVTPGCLFFALRGERFDGNDFAAGALEAGAAFAVVDRPDVLKNDRFILVKDVLEALQELARFHRRQFQIPILAITGSNGKTTTKELVSAVLGSHYPLHFTRGNFNNHIGVPLTLLAMPPEIEVAVIEMGANHQGEIDALCRIAEPTHGIITNVGKAHLEGFGGEEGVRKGKSELYRFLAERDGMVFVNRDAEYLKELAGPVRKKLLYGRADPLHPLTSPYEVELLASQPFISVAFREEDGQRIIVNSRLVGAYNFNNIMTAIVIGKYFKVPASKIKVAIEAYEPSNNRSQVVRRETNVVILDAYNANPTSMRAAIDTFRQLPAGRKVAILGDMLELGAYAETEHESIARYAADQGFEMLILVGELFAAPARRWNCLHFPDAETLGDWLAGLQFQHTHFLLKGSRRIHLETVLDRL